MGLGMALFEEGVPDREFGGYANHDFATYHVPSIADSPEFDVAWIDDGGRRRRQFHQKGRPRAGKANLDRVLVDGGDSAQAIRETGDEIAGALDVGEECRSAEEEDVPVGGGRIQRARQGDDDRVGGDRCAVVERRVVDDEVVHVIPPRPWQCAVRPGGQ